MPRLSATSLTSSDLRPAGFRNGEEYIPIPHNVNRGWHSFSEQDPAKMARIASADMVYFPTTNVVTNAGSRIFGVYDRETADWLMANPTKNEMRTHTPLDRTLGYLAVPANVKDYIRQREARKDHIVTGVNQMRKRRARDPEYQIQRIARVLRNQWNKPGPSPLDRFRGRMAARRPKPDVGGSLASLYETPLAHRGKKTVHRKRKRARGSARKTIASAPTAMQKRARRR